MEGGNQQQQPNPLVARSTVTDVRGQESFVAVLPESSVKRPGKVPFEKGYSQMDWMRLTKRDPDLAGLRGASRKRQISMAEVATHATPEDAWTVFRGKVYNLTPYIDFHPGGDKILRAILGKDCTAHFNKYHAWVNGEYMLEKCKVGVLDTPVPGSDSEDSEEEEEEEDFSFR